MKSFPMILLLSIASFAGTGKIIKVVHYTEHSERNFTIIEGLTSSNPVVNTNWDMLALTVELDRVTYTGNFRAKFFHSSDLMIGNPIEARVEGENLIITRPDGKTQKTKIVERTAAP